MEIKHSGSQPSGKGPEECWLIRWIAQHPPL